jgi:hypothetical protein
VGRPQIKLATWTCPTPPNHDCGFRVLSDQYPSLGSIRVGSSRPECLLYLGDARFGAEWAQWLTVTRKAVRKKAITAEREPGMPGDSVALHLVHAHCRQRRISAGQLPGGFDNAQKAWVIPAANPNLRIAGTWSGPVDGMLVFGFQIGMLPSFVSVARYRDRYVLKDGYHRAFGFLRPGIKCVPAFVRDVQSFEALGLLTTGMLPQDAYLGEHPPLLSD